MVLLAGAAPKIMEAGAVKNGVHRKPHGVERPVVSCRDALFQLAYADTADSADNACKVLIYDFVRQTDRLEDPCRLVGLDRRYSHLCGDFHHAAKESLVVISNRRVHVLIKQAESDQLADALVGKIRIDCPRAEAENAGRLVDVPHLAALKDQRNSGPLSRMDKMLFNSRHGKQGRDRHMIFVDAAVREDDNICTL